MTRVAVGQVWGDGDGLLCLVTRVQAMTLDARVWVLVLDEGSTGAWARGEHDWLWAESVEALMERWEG